MFAGRKLFNSKTASILIGASLLAGLVAAGPQFADKKLRDNDFGRERDHDRANQREHDRPVVVGGLEINFGGGWRERDRFPEPVRCEPAPRCEIAPISLDFDAYQADDSIILIARGQNPTPGFVTTLERTKRFGQTIITLRNFAPERGPRGGFVAQCLTQFEVAGSLNAAGCADQLTVYVNGCAHVVQVRHIANIPRTL